MTADCCCFQPFLHQHGLPNHHKHFRPHRRPLRLSTAIISTVLHRHQTALQDSRNSPSARPLVSSWMSPSTTGAGCLHQQKSTKINNNQSSTTKDNERQPSIINCTTDGSYFSLGLSSEAVLGSSQPSLTSLCVSSSYQTNGDRQTYANTHIDTTNTWNTLWIAQQNQPTNLPQAAP